MWKMPPARCRCIPAWDLRPTRGGPCSSGRIRRSLGPRPIDRSVSMQYRQLGKAGVKVSAVGVGCNQFGSTVDREGTAAIVHRALDLGINFFDTADTYGNRGGSEGVLGHALAGRGGPGG